MHHPNATPPYAQLPLPLRPNELSIIAITLWHRDKQATQRKGDRDRERERANEMEDIWPIESITATTLR